jgi:hypothetical protein
MKKQKRRQSLGGLSTVILHLLEYRVVPGHEAEVAGFLRQQATAARADEGVVFSCHGRRLGTQGREHMAATLWSGWDSYRRGTDGEGLPTFLSAISVLLGVESSTRYRVVASTGLHCEGVRILRLYRTTIAADAVETWERRALEPVGQLASRDGLLTIVAGVGKDQDGSVAQAGEISVVVLTAWSDWNLLLTATGGRLNSALADTELADIERPANAFHYEVIGPEPRPR